MGLIFDLFLGGGGAQTCISESHWCIFFLHFDVYWWIDKSLIFTFFQYFHALIKFPGKIVETRRTEGVWSWHFSFWCTSERRSPSSTNSASIWTMSRMGTAWDRESTNARKQRQGGWNARTAQLFPRWKIFWSQPWNRRIDTSDAGHKKHSLFIIRVIIPIMLTVNMVHYS